MGERERERGGCVSGGERERERCVSGEGAGCGVHMNSIKIENR